MTENNNWWRVPLGYQIGHAALRAWKTVAAHDRNLLPLISWSLSASSRVSMPPRQCIFLAEEHCSLKALIVSFYFYTVLWSSFNVVIITTFKMTGFLTLLCNFTSLSQYLQMKWPLLDVPGAAGLKDSRSSTPSHLVSTCIKNLFCSPKLSLLLSVHLLIFEIMCHSGITPVNNSFGSCEVSVSTSVAF